jgi:serine/threonine protein kinase
MPMVAALVMSLVLGVNPWFRCPHVLANTEKSVNTEASETEGAPLESGGQSPAVYLQIKALAISFLDKIGLDYEFAKLYAIWIVGAPTLVVLILIAMMLRPGRKTKTSTASERHPRIGASQKGRPRARDAKKSTSISDKERVLAFFFQLFKQQVGAPPDAPTRLSLIESRSTCPNDTYEMRVKLENDWASRRMSIGLLGQGGGSRSKCYYVIYDSHMVLKLPSKPIPEFSVYRKKIKAEAKIVEKLYPRECIVPKMSVILKAVHTIKDSQFLSEELQEAKYVHLLEVNPEYQEYLKIGSSFAFFMDLAKHFFLSTTLEEIHCDDQRIVSEALKQQELLWDQHGFACRYGEDVSEVCHELQDAYYRNEGSLRLLIEEAQIIEDIPTFQLKQWFVNHLAGEKVDAATEELPHELIDRVNRLLYNVLRENHQQVERYRQSVRRYIKEMHFSQHRNQLENLASNTLNLLAWIDEKDLTMRDLKPENLFVAGETNAYPLFLNDPKKFSIGLIDVETAVVMGSKNTEEIPQPQLAGTPLYATPSHLLSNVILKEVYGDVRAILHLQDWYATIAIIYKTITGKNMFSATAMVFPDLVKQIKLMDPAGPDMDKDMARINRLFWTSAVAEFKQSLAADLDIIERIEVAVPVSMVVDIVKSLHAGCDHLSSVLAKTISQQSVFVGREKCQYLLDVSAEKITAMKQKLLQESPHGRKRKEHHDKAIAVLVHIEEQKRALQRKLEAAASLKTKVGAIAADQLLEAMFERVFSSMYLAHWPMVDPAKWRGDDDGRLDIATYQATM